jgi:hypothetical protein
MVDSVKDSELVELNEKKTMIRRKGNTAIPDLSEEAQ